MSPENRLKFQNILIILVVGLLFGLLYNFLFYPHSFIEFLEAGSISIILGLKVGVLEEFVFKKFFQKKSFMEVTLLRSLIYALMISTVLSLVLSIEIAFTEKVGYYEAVVSYLSGPLFRRDFTYSFLFIIIMLFILQIILLVGRANFFRLLVGMYHQPREIERIFMFTDLNNSTGIAEQLSNTAYSSFIKDFFYDISDAVLMFGGEVYQYVGDEIIVVWPVRSKKPNCLQCFFKMEEIIVNKRDVYLSKYGIAPTFKAGIHAGPVIVTSVGKIKKEIVYHGDVLNTSSRIEGQCKSLGQPLLVSADLLKFIDIGNVYNIEEKGNITLKGKSSPLVLYGVSIAH